MVVAGNETTTKLLGHALFHLTRHPDQLATGLRRTRTTRAGRARGSRRRCATTPPASCSRGYLLEDVELHGTVAPAGLQAAALPRLGQPRRAGLLPTRTTTTSSATRTSSRQILLSFGGGRHFCLGANLARLEARVALRALVERVRTVEVDHDALRAGALRQRARLRRRCRCGWRCADGSEVRPARPPARRRHRRLAPASAPPPRSALAAAGFPVALGARRTDKLRGGRRPDPRGRRRGGRARRSTSPTTTRSTAFAKAVTADLGDIEVVVSQRRRGRARARSTRSTPSGSPASSTSTVVGAHRLVRAFVPAWSSGAAATSSSSPPTSRSAPRPFMAAYAAGKWGLEGMVARAADGARGHRRPRVASSAPARPGARWAATGTPRTRPIVLNQWVRFGLARHPHFLKPAAIADAITTIVSAPRGVHLNLVEVDPRSTRGGPMTRAITRGLVRRPRRRHGHLAEMRVDPIGLFAPGARRVRRHRPVPAGRPRRRAGHRRRGQRAVLPGAGLDARPGGGVPVHDADLRQGRGLRRLARGAPADAEEPGAARRHDARPRRRPSRPRSTGWSPTGATRARSTCSTGSPS